MITLNQNTHNKSPLTHHKPVSSLRSKIAPRSGVPFARYPSELVFQQHLQLKRNLAQSAREGKSTLNAPFRGLARGVSQWQPRRNTHQGNTGGEQRKIGEVNSNLRRAWGQVEKAIMRQGSTRSLPFKIVKSLSVRTLRRKGQVQQLRKEMHRLHQINPFGSRVVQSEYLN